MVEITSLRCLTSSAPGGKSSTRPLSSSQTLMCAASVPDRSTSICWAFERFWVTDFARQQAREKKMLENQLSAGPLPFTGYFLHKCFGPMCQKRTSKTERFRAAAADTSGHAGLHEGLTLGLLLP